MFNIFKCRKKISRTLIFFECVDVIFINLYFDFFRMCGCVFINLFSHTTSENIWKENELDAANRHQHCFIEILEK